MHAALRGATAAAHHALDHHPVLRCLTSSDLSRELYAEALAAMYPAHARLERLVLGSRHHCGSDLMLSPRLALLQADLLDLGRPVPAVAQGPSDLLDGRATWLGRVYVLEGSRLGGAVIARRVRSILGDEVPCRFFGAPTAADERSALRAMCERELRDPAELERGIAGARAAFAAYRAGLDDFRGGSVPSGCDRAP